MDQQDTTRAAAVAATGLRRLPHATERFDGPTTLYRMYDEAGQLLYIGVTCNTAQRWDSHRALSPWWPLVASKKLTVYPDRRSALMAETAAIRAEAPAHNVSDNPRAGRRDVHLVLKGERAKALADLARAERLSISKFVMKLIDAALADAANDPDMDEALRRVRATAQKGGAR
ncbi:GIY-YIG nuclease family protein [Streptomyces sp. P9(2023)]|uniref:GIY-YIG nuclease family protein n=1 Tax=Streptomyces sp. P9(2023) TaxID=3064394 RepID=UPI0028F4020A|nr:GIY-YIG nuclease family protein [Streptomyces sp. P9(2023)]MDT9689412.1 GIY-YIG nuclease family protein [Streptomyces sp. P9(2023)]